MEWNFVGDQLLRGKEAVRRYMAKAYLEPSKFMVDELLRMIFLPQLAKSA